MALQTSKPFPLEEFRTEVELAINLSKSPFRDPELLTEAEK